MTHNVRGDVDLPYLTCKLIQSPAEEPEVKLPEVDMEYLVSEHTLL